MARCLLISLFLVPILAGCGSQSEAAHVATATRAQPVQAAVPTTEQHAQTVTVHFGPGKQHVTAKLHEPEGVILLYQLTAPAGVSVRGVVQQRPITAPLGISTGMADGSCKTVGARRICTVGEEWCPMPKGVWTVRIQKRSGPAGDVTLRFHVGPPPAGSGA